MSDRTRTPRVPSDQVATTVSLFRKGDRAATRQIRHRVHRILAFRGYGIAAQDRMDLEQRIMIELWQAVSRSGFEAAGFWGFAEVVASRRCIDWHRARREATTLEKVDEPCDPQMSPQGRVLEKERIELARAVLDQLPSGCRELIRLHASENKTYREIAEILGGSETALRVRLHRCIKRAQVILEGMTDP
jgi:RNA polymerase sigma factor (sigma-70 family)